MVNLTLIVFQTLTLRNPYPDPEPCSLHHIPSINPNLILTLIIILMLPNPKINLHLNNMLIVTLIVNLVLTQTIPTAYPTLADADA